MLPLQDSQTNPLASHQPFLYHSLRSILSIGFLVCGLFFAGCTTLPPNSVQRSAFHDLNAMITQYERTDWLTDEAAYQDLAPRIQETVCQTPQEARQGLRTWLEQQIEQKGGSAKTQWGAGVPLSELKSVLRLERVLGSLTFSEQRQDGCPFWLQPKKEFRGIHRDYGRLLFIGESMGSFQLINQNNDYFLGGAGQGRLLSGYGVHENLSLALGLEVGGASIFPKDDLGQRTVRATWAAGIPFISRTLIGNYVWDVEAAALGRYQEGSDKIQPGFRLASAIGVRTLRIAGLQPHILVWMGYERFSGPPDEFQIVRAGTRVGFSWSPESSYH